MSESGTLESIDDLIQECFAFFGAFLMLHKQWLHALAKARRFHKWPNYEVLELLSSEEEGLYGFQVHFSNGSRSTYTRRKSGIEASNLTFRSDGGFDYMVGLIDAMEPLWKINGQPVQDWTMLP